MNILPIPAFKDNYIWTLIDSHARQAWVVDPGDAKPVRDYLENHQLELSGILITHHHFDHTGGVAELIDTWKDIPVYASHASLNENVTHPVREQEEILCAGVKLKVLEIPGHTMDHVAYYNENMLFCGDTLFSAGCGRVFEGTPKLMYESLSKLYQLPENIKIYCGHEYTLANLMFAQLVEPDNSFISEKILAVKANLNETGISLPSILADEKKMNPFLRCEAIDVIRAAETQANHKLTDSVEVFATLREWKNKL